MHNASLRLISDEIVNTNAEVRYNTSILTIGHQYFTINGPKYRKPFNHFWKLRLFFEKYEQTTFTLQGRA